MDVFTVFYNKVESLGLDDARKEILYDVLAESFGFSGKRPTFEDTVKATWGRWEKLQQEYRGFRESCLDVY